MLLSTEPLWAALSAAFLLGEALGLNDVAGGALIVGAWACLLAVMSRTKFQYRSKLFEVAHNTLLTVFSVVTVIGILFAAGERGACGARGARGGAVFLAGGERGALFVTGGRARGGSQRGRLRAPGRRGGASTPASAAAAAAAGAARSGDGGGGGG